jgi:GntR family transcriptional regulator
MYAINYRDSRPIYEQIMDELRKLIISGVFAPDEKLPSVRELAQQLAINPNTIQRAYMQLEQEGYIYTVVGRGNYVTDRSEWQKGYQSIARQELDDALVKAKSSGLSLEVVLAMAKSCYAKDNVTASPGDPGNLANNAVSTAKEDGQHD